MYEIFRSNFSEVYLLLGVGEAEKMLTKFKHRSRLRVINFDIKNNIFDVCYDKLKIQIKLISFKD